MAVTQPAPNATGVAAITEVKYTSEDPAKTSVVVKDSDGTKVAGTLDRDAKTWRPARGLNWGEKYSPTASGLP